MILQIIITIFGWIALLYISINLIGMFIRGLVLTSEVRKLFSKGDAVFKRVVDEFYKPKVEKKTTITAFVLIVIYLGALFYFWNIGVVIVALLLMVARIPDLLWEMKHGGVGGSEEIVADALSRPNALNGKYRTAQNGYGLMFEDFQSKKGFGLFRRANLADVVIMAAERNGINTSNQVEASLLGEFVVAMTREGKITMQRHKEMPAIYMLTSLVVFAALPALWYALYKL